MLRQKIGDRMFKRYVFASSLRVCRHKQFRYYVFDALELARKLRQINFPCSPKQTHNKYNPSMRKIPAWNIAKVVKAQIPVWSASGRKKLVPIVQRSCFQSIAWRSKNRMSTTAIWCLYNRRDWFYWCASQWINGDVVLVPRPNKTKCYELHTSGSVVVSRCFQCVYLAWERLVPNVLIHWLKFCTRTVWTWQALNAMEVEMELDWIESARVAHTHISTSTLYHSHKSSIKCHLQKFNHIIFIGCSFTRTGSRCSKNHLQTHLFRPSMTVGLHPCAHTHTHTCVHSAAPKWKYQQPNQHHSSSNESKHYKRKRKCFLLIGAWFK